MPSQGYAQQEPLAKSEPKLVIDLKYLEDSITEISNKLNFTQDRMHSIVNLRTPEKGANLPAVPMPDDIHGRLQVAIENLRMQINRVEAINGHIENIV